MKELTLKEFQKEIELRKNLCIKDIIVKNIKINNGAINDMEFIDCRLYENDFLKSTLDKIEISNSDVLYGNFKNSIFKTINIENSMLLKSDFSQCVFEQNSQSQATAIFKECIFKEISNNGSIFFIDSTFIDCDFEKANMQKIDYAGSIFINPNFDEAKIEESGFSLVNFINCHTEDTNFKSSNFDNSNLVDCKFESSNFLDAAFEEVVIRNVYKWIPVDEKNSPIMKGNKTLKGSVIRQVYDKNCNQTSSHRYWQTSNSRWKRAKY